MYIHALYDKYMYDKYICIICMYVIGQVTLAISDIKRSKMVKTVNIYYSNRTMQNIIELKNKYVITVYTSSV